MVTRNNQKGILALKEEIEGDIEYYHQKCFDAHKAGQEELIDYYSGYGQALQKVVANLEELLK